MFCSNCGKELEAGDVFCGYCGVRQEPVPEPIVEEPAAGNEGPAVGDAAQGTQANEEATSSQGASAAPVAAAGKSLVGWVLAGVVMVIVLIAALSNGTPPSRREPPISVRVSNTLQKDTTKEVKSDNTSNLKEVPTTSTPKSTVVTTTAASSTSVTPPPGCGW